MGRRSIPSTASAEASEASSLKRGLDILRSLNGRSTPLTVSELASQPGMSRPTAQRLLQTLAAEGFLRATSEREDAFEPELGCLTLGTAALSSISDIWQRQPVLQELSRRYGVDVLAATRDGSQGVVLEHATLGSHRPSLVGSGFQLESGALGRCLVWVQPPAVQAELVEAIRSRASRPAAELAALYSAFQCLEERRYCVSDVDDRTTEFAMPVPPAADQPTLAISCVGPREVIADPVRGAALRAELASIAGHAPAPSPHA